MAKGFYELKVVCHYVSVGKSFGFLKRVNLPGLDCRSDKKNLFILEKRQASYSS